MNTTPFYKKAVTVPVTASSDSAFPGEGKLFAAISRNYNQAPPTYQTEANYSADFSIPVGAPATEGGDAFPIPAMVDITYRVEDWGYVALDDSPDKFIDLTMAKDAPGIYGGHKVWERTRNIILFTGAHTMLTPSF